MIRCLALYVLKVGGLIASLAVVGCASTTGGRAPPSASDFAATTLDHDRIARVEHVARQSGVSVVWVNPPRQHKHE